MFIGRKKELETISEAFLSDRQENILTYGRRRVGKTELIKEAIKGKKAIYYEAKEITETKIIEELTILISEAMDLPRLWFDDVGSLLESLFKMAQDEVIILVLDEYTYMQDAIKGLDSIIMSLIDKYSKTSKLKLILCGSYIDTMKKLLEYGNPLYGRFRYIIDLKQMDYYDSSKFYASKSEEDKVALYSVFGGIPFYNSLIDETLSVKDNIIKLILDNNSVLYNEVDTYLKGELSKLENANGVFDAIASGKNKYTEIFDKSGIKSNPTVSVILSKLTSMELVKKEAPINDLDNKKKTHYYISDNFINFYYRFIHRYRSQLVVMDKEKFYKRYIEKEFNDTYVPKVFEDICKQYLIRKNLRNELEESFDLIGKYYYDDPKTKTNGEFDVVTEDETGYIFYECKYTDKKVTQAIIDKEIEQVKKTGLRCYKYGFFSKSGYETINSKNLILYTLPSLYI